MLKSDDIKIFPIFRSVSDQVANIGNIKYNLNPENYLDLNDARELTRVLYAEMSLLRGSVLFEASYNDRTLGFAMAGNIENGDTEEMYLKELYVHREYQYPFLRKHGRPALNIGSQLLHTTEQVMSLYGRSVRLESSEVGKRLYENRGYQKHEKYHQIHDIYSKKLHPAPDGVYPLFAMTDKMCVDAARIFKDCYKVYFNDTQAYRWVDQTIGSLIRHNKVPAFGYFADNQLQGLLLADDAHKNDMYRVNADGAPIQEPPMGKPNLTLEHLYVAKNFRDNGVGTNLVNTFLCWADRVGVSQIDLWLLDETQRLTDFYSRFGFVSLNDSSNMVRTR